MMLWAEIIDFVADGVEDVTVDANHSRQMWGMQTYYRSIFEELGLKNLNPQSSNRPLKLWGPAYITLHA